MEEVREGPEEGCWPPGCAVLLSFCDPDLVRSKHGERTLAPES